MTGTALHFLSDLCVERNENGRFDFLSGAKYITIEDVSDIAQIG